MQKQSLNIDRVSLTRLTENHYRIGLFNLELDFSGISDGRGGKRFKLFSVSIRDHKDNLYIICRALDKYEKAHNGQHFNIIEPNKKKRLERRKWKKACNKLLGYFKLELPKGETL